MIYVQCIGEKGGFMEWVECSGQGGQLISVNIEMCVWWKVRKLIKKDNLCHACEKFRKFMLVETSEITCILI